MSGARIALHLALELGRRGGGVGAAALCGGGGQGDALILHVARQGVTSEGHRGPDAGTRQAPRGRRGRRAADVPTLVERAREGDARSVARLISLVEDASPALREVAAALAPHTGHAQVLGLTGSPGVGKSTTTTALVRALRPGGQAGRRARRRPVVPVLRRCAARRPRADAGPRRRQRRLHPVDGLPRAPRRAGLVDPAGAAGARRRRLRRRADRDRRRRAVRAGDRLAGRHHAGADRAGDGRRDPGGQGRDPGGRRRLRRQQGRPGRRRPDRARPALHALPRRAALRGRALAAADLQDRGRRGTPTTASTRCWPRSRSTASGWSPPGEGHRRRSRAGRARDRGDRAGRAARSGWATCTARRRSASLAEQVVAGETDPYRAADELLAQL